MIPAIFKDNTLQEAFDENGFVIVPLLSAHEIDKLTELFHQFHPTSEANRFGASSFLKDKSEKLTIRDTLYPIFLPHFNSIFKDYSYFGSSFLYKTKGKNSDLAPHQDWTIVDESKYVAINIWTPLTDTVKANGTLYVVPKSQSQKHYSLRAPTLPFYFQEYEETVIKCAIPTNAKAGEAVILNQSLIHFSTANMVDKNRIAITSGLKSAGAPMLFHYLNEQNEIERYQMPEDFLLDFKDFYQSIYERPANGKLLDTFSPSHNKLTKKEFIGLFEPTKASFFSRWF